MKVRYYYCWSNNGERVYGHAPRLWYASDLLDALEITNQSFNKYLLSALDTDFNQNRYGQVDEVLLDIEKLERGEIEHCMAGTPDTLKHTITRTKVTFEHAIFGECPEWPLWSCSLAQYKAALQGYRKFLDMPESIESELIVELPDGDA